MGREVGGRAYRRAEIQAPPRGMTREDAADYCRLSPTTWDKWVSEGKMPPPVTGTHRWDRRAIDRAWDKLSGLDMAEQRMSADEIALAEWRKARGYAG